MDKMWVFGDSFGEDRKNGRKPILEQQWHRQLSRALNFSVMNQAVHGSGLEWLYYSWHLHRQEIDDGDLVVVTLTEITRRWLIKDHPQYSNPWAFSKFGKSWPLSAEQIKAMEMYYRYLSNDQLQPVFLENWFYSVRDLQQNKKCKILIIPCFKLSENDLLGVKSRFTDICFADGYLFEISKKEHVPNIRNNMIISDGRPNHISPLNHQVLFDKILSWYKYDTPVDLNQGFHENIIDGSDFTDPNMFATEHKIKLME